MSEPLVRALLEVFPEAALIGMRGAPQAQEQLREALSEMGLGDVSDDVDLEALEAFLNEGEDLE